MVTASLVKELREKTGAGMMECKKALIQTEGDINKAADLLREKGITKAANKQSRIATEGEVYCHISENKKIGVIIEINTETDFVAKNEEFKLFVKEVAKVIEVEKPKNVEELENKSMENKTVKEILTEKIATIGEKIDIRRFERYETEGFIESYVHGNGKIGVMVDFAGEDSKVAKDVCMQIAAARPEYIAKEDVPEDILNHEMEILKQQAINEGKPENVAQKIVLGRIGKFYGDVCLLEQAFVKSPEIKVGKLLKDSNSNIVKFSRYEKGEGLEKREENFAEEVKKISN